MAKSKWQMDLKWQTEEAEEVKWQVRCAVRHLNFAFCYLPFEFLYR